MTDLLKFAVIAPVVAGVMADPGCASDLGEAKDVLSACAQRLTLDA
jgi:hypothetical protein